MGSTGQDALQGSVYLWQQELRRVELVHREGVTWLHATDDDDIVIVELPPRVIGELRDALNRLPA